MVWNTHSHSCFNFLDHANPKIIGGNSFHALNTFRFFQRDVKTFVNRESFDSTTEYGMDDWGSIPGRRRHQFQTGSGTPTASYEICTLLVISPKVKLGS
jgi:hypothetical protein